MIITARRKCKANYRVKCKNSFKNLVKVSIEPTAHVASTKFSYLNAGSLKNKTFGLHDYIVSNHLDILAVTETWLFPEDQQNLIYLTELLPHNYKICHIPRSNGQHAGGVAIVYRDSFLLDTVNSSNVADNQINQFEFIDCNLRFNKKIVFRLLVVYRPPPSKKNKLKVKYFWKDWTKFLSDIILCHHDWIIVGDLNFHLDDTKKYHSKRFCKILDEFGLVQHIKHPTHTAQHILDVLITPTDCSRIVQSSIVVHDPCISDNQGNLADSRHFAISWASKHMAKNKKQGNNLS